MPAGSGPSAVQATAVAVTTSEAIIATTPVSNWSGVAGGTLLTVSVNYSPAASNTALVLRIRQTNSVTGTLVGVARTSTVANPNSYELGFEMVDTSAFGQNQAGGQYVLTAQGTGAGGTANIVTLLLETTAPVQ